MVIFAVELFNGGNDIVIHYDDNYGRSHFVSRKVKMVVSNSITIIGKLVNYLKWVSQYYK